MLLIALPFLLHCLPLQGQQDENWAGLGATFMVHLQSQPSLRGGGELKRGDSPSEQTSVWLGSASADVRGREEDKVRML